MSKLERAEGRTQTQFRVLIADTFGALGRDGMNTITTWGTLQRIILACKPYARDATLAATT